MTPEQRAMLEQMADEESMLAASANDGGPTQARRVARCAALRAALGATWQPINTAPKDGLTLILLTDGRDVMSGCWNRGGAFCGPHWMAAKMIRPTHWHPAPLPLPAVVTGCPECDSGNTPHTLSHEDLL